MDKSLKYFLKYMLYYFITILGVSLIFFLISKVIGDGNKIPDYRGIVPLLSMFFAGNMLIALNQDKKILHEIDQNKNKIALYFGLFQLILGGVLTPFFSPVHNLWINVIIVIVAALIGYGICYYGIQRRLKIIPKQIKMLKENIKKTKDPKKKKRLVEYLKKIE